MRALLPLLCRGWLVLVLTFFMVTPPAMGQDVLDFFGAGEGARPEVPPPVAQRVQPAGGDITLGPEEQKPVEPAMDGGGGDMPFGWELFADDKVVARALGVNPDYVIAPGDRVQVQVWGAEERSETAIVDLQGNIFLPDVGPVQVGGRTQAELNSVVRAAIARVFTDRVQVYTNLMTTQPVGVYVSGAVKRPGRYAGERTDSLIYYLQQAGGIDLERGAFRDISIKRRGRVLASVDLYDFLLSGDIPNIQFQSDDSIVVGAQGPTVQVSGAVRNAYRFELEGATATGSTMMDMAQPYASTSHVAISGIRNNRPYNTYLPLERFSDVVIRDGDKLVFHADRVAETIFVSALGQMEGPSSFAVSRGTTLDKVLDIIPVDPGTAELGAIYLRRDSVAKRQKRALERALDDLQRNALTAPASTSTEASIRVQEAALIQQFIQRARAVEPEGRVVLGDSRGLSDVIMEDGDVIVVPQKSELVTISGEVRLPQTVLYRPDMTVESYIKAAGGYTDRANTDTVLVLRQSGEVVEGSSPALLPGDHLMVLPSAGNKNLAVVKDIIEIVYRVAVSSGIVVNLF